MRSLLGHWGYSKSCRTSIAGLLNPTTWKKRTDPYWWKKVFCVQWWRDGTYVPTQTTTKVIAPLGMQVSGHSFQDTWTSALANDIASTQKLPPCCIPTAQLFRARLQSLQKKAGHQPSSCLMIHRYLSTQTKKTCPAIELRWMDCRLFHCQKFYVALGRSFLKTIHGKPK